MPLASFAVQDLSYRLDHASPIKNTLVLDEAPRDDKFFSDFLSPHYPGVGPVIPGVTRRMAQRWAEECEAWEALK